MTTKPQPEAQMPEEIWTNDGIYILQSPIEDCVQYRRADLASPAPWHDMAALQRASMWLDTKPNAPKHFTKAGNEHARETIRALLDAAIANHPDRRGA